MYDDEEYNANDDYDRYQHTGELAVLFEDEPEDDEVAPYNCCDGTAPIKHWQIDEKKQKAGCASLLLLVLVVATILFFIIKRLV